MSKTKFLERFETSGLDVPNHVLYNTIKDDINSVRLDVFDTKSITNEHLNVALNHDDWIVRLYAARHPNATKEHLDKALTDYSPYVRRAVKLNTNYDKYFPNGH